MKRLVIVLMTSAFVAMLFVVANGFQFIREDFVTDQMVDLSKPFSGKIDLTYLQEIQNLK